MDIEFLFPVLTLIVCLKHKSGLYIAINCLSLPAVLFFILKVKIESRGIDIIKFEPVREKKNSLGSEQVRHKLCCTVTGDA